MSDFGDMGWIDNLPNLSEDFLAAQQQVEEQIFTQVSLNDRLEASGSTLRVAHDAFEPEHGKRLEREIGTSYKTQESFTLGVSRFFLNGDEYTTRDGNERQYEYFPGSIGLQNQISDHIYTDLNFEQNSAYGGVTTSLSACAETHSFLGFRGGSIGACSGLTYGLQDEVDKDLLIFETVVPRAGVFATARLSNSEGGFIPQNTDAVIGIDMLASPQGVEPLGVFSIRIPIEPR